MIPDGHLRHYSARVRAWWWLVIAPVGLIAGLVFLLVGANITTEIRSGNEQSALAPFYEPPSPLPPTPGTVIRTEPLGVDVPGATALRILYVSARPDGTPAASGGMIFIPTAPAPPEGRPVVAWAHGTLGMGDACAPSRSDNPLGDTANWLDSMLALGYVVVATDYVGLGTPGPELYLVGEAEAHDVVNSVRAARALPEADAGDRYVVWGHSQGGHSALWTGHLSETIAPELSLLGVAAAAPAAELTRIMDAQWDTTIGWGIGPEVAISWPVADPALSPDQVLTFTGERTYQRIADQCTSNNTLLLELALRKSAGQKFFSENPLDNTAWAAFAERQTPPPFPSSMPLFIAQGTTDEVVLPWPNAYLQEKWCAAGSDLTMMWMGDIGHIKAAVTAGPVVTQWVADRFAGRPTTRNCEFPPAVPPQKPANAG
ncbi:MAG: lipase [Actinobacteria bacterium]|nr:lipase [Actinomycetota bacterium]